jgi:hypothetical protein
MKSNAEIIEEDRYFMKFPPLFALMYPFTTLIDDLNDVINQKKGTGLNFDLKKGTGLNLYQYAMLSQQTKIEIFGDAVETLDFILRMFLFRNFHICLY